MSTATIWILLSVYLAVCLGVGFFANRQGKRTAEDYFLASRGLGPFVYFFTMAATFQSAFALFGISGMAYGIGFGAIMWSFLANCFTAFTLYFVAYRVWLVGRERRFISPTEFFADRYRNEAMVVLTLLTMAVFSIPYLAIQPLSAGYALTGISKGAIPHLTGVWLLVGVQIIYTFLGGMRADAWSDVFQGIVMWVGAIVGGLIILSQVGPLDALAAKVLTAKPTHFSIGEGAASWKLLVSFAFIGIATTLMAPQMFMRMYAARSARAIKATALTWIPAMVLLQLPAVVIGVLGRGILPDLKQADTVMPTLMGQYLPLWLATILMAAVFAAMMSTVDSILLTLSSMVTRDIYVRYLRKGASETEQFWAGRSVVVLLGVVGGIMAMNPPGTITALLVWAFSCFGMLFPATVAGLYWRRATGWGAVAGTLVGLVAVIGEGSLYPKAWLMGFYSIVPALILNAVVLWSVSLVTQPVGETHLKPFYGALERVFGPHQGKRAAAAHGD